MSVNIVILEGNISTDIYSNTTPSGKTNVFFRLAVDGRSEDQTRFFAVKSWGPQGEAVAKYCSKGSRVMVQGQLDNYKDKNQVEVTLVNFAQVTFLNTRKNGNAPDEAAVMAGDAVTAAVAGDDVDF